MTLAVKIPIKKTQEVKKFLVQNDLVDKDYRMKKSKDYIWIPVRKKGMKKKFGYVEYEDVQFVKNVQTKGGLKEGLRGKLSDSEMKKVQRAHDVIGDIAIIEVPVELKGKDKVIAKTLMDMQPNIKTVLKKVGIHSDEFRTIPLKWVAGCKTKEAMTRENGVRLLLDVEKVYYSPRSSTERSRVMKMVKPSEEVLVMFSGCGPFTCAIGKNTSAKLVVGVEKNPVGHAYEAENIVSNKIRNAKAVLGDVRRVVPLLGKFDRVLMPLPMSAEDFLDVALKAVRKGGVVHLYQFINLDDKAKTYKMIKDKCTSVGKKCRILRMVKCGQFSPKKFRVCVDIKVE